MRPKRQDDPFLNLLLPVGLQSFFALAALLLCMAGGLLYRSVQQDADAAGQRTTAESYFFTRLQQVGAEDGVAVRREDGKSVLVVSRSYEGVPYETRVFAEDGALKECFVQADQPLSGAGAGEICAVEQADFAMDDTGLVQVRFTYRDGSGSALSYRLEGGAGE